MTGTEPQHGGAHLLAGAADDLTAEFAGVFSRETVLDTLLDSWQRLDGSKVQRWRPLSAYRFARERLQATATVRGLTPRTVPQVLFVCTHNSARSQLAAAILADLAGNKVVIRSAGTDPAPAVDPGVVAVLAEVGISLADAFPKPLTAEIVQAADVVVTMGCGDTCPVFPGRRYLDWDLADPVGHDPDGDLSSVRQVRDAITEHVRHLLADLTNHPADAQPSTPSLELR